MRNCRPIGHGENSVALCGRNRGGIHLVASSLVTLVFVARLRHPKGSREGGRFARGARAKDKPTQGIKLWTWGKPAKGHSYNEQDYIRKVQSEMKFREDYDSKRLELIEERVQALKIVREKSDQRREQHMQLLLDEWNAAKKKTTSLEEQLYLLEAIAPDDTFYEGESPEEDDDEGVWEEPKVSYIEDMASEEYESLRSELIKAKRDEDEKGKSVANMVKIINDDAFEALIAEHGPLDRACQQAEKRAAKTWAEWERMRTLHLKGDPAVSDEALEDIQCSFNSDMETVEAKRNELLEACSSTIRI